MMRLLLFFVLLWTPAWALAGDTPALQLRGHFTPGGLVRGQVEPGSTVSLDGAPLLVDGEGRFTFGFDRDAAGQSSLVVRYPDGREETHTLKLKPREYQIQRINGLPPKMVTPDQETLTRIGEESARLKAARRHVSSIAGFWQDFQWPAQGPISGVFGSQRVLNGEPRSPHNGLDIAAARGTPVVAPAAGIVRLAVTDYYYTGGTVVLDHGHGLSSVYVHLDRVDVTEGAELAAGDVIGAVGATGRVTGPHLHWGVNWGDVRLDPALLLSPETATTLP